MNLKKIINNSELTINKKEQEIKEQKDTIINFYKVKKDLSNTALNLSVQKACLENILKQKDRDLNRLNQVKYI